MCWEPAAAGNANFGQAQYVGYAILAAPVQ